MKSIIHYVSIFCVCALTFSCQKKTADQDKNLVFRYNENANIQTLDPAFARNMAIIWPCNQLFNGLVQLDDSLHIQADIAKSWTISEDGKQYDFMLRRDVYFHKHSHFGADSTRTVVASDFEYSFNRVLDADVVSPGAWIFQKVKNFKAINDTVFRIELKEAFPAFLGLLSMRYASVVPREIVEDKTIDFRSHPIGTGPFYFKFWEENIKLVLRKNPNYFEKDEKGNQLPYLEAVSITFLPDKQSGFLQFLQGNLDFISGLDPSYKDDIITENGELNPKYKEKVQMVTGPYLNTEYLGFNLEAPGAIQDVRIRKALNMGFDRNKMLLYLRSGMGDGAVGGIIPQGLGGHFSTDKLYNPEEAKALVDDYKKTSKESKVEITLSTNANYLDIAEYLQREWKKLGIEVIVDVTPPASLRQGMASGKVSFFRGSWIADYPDAENYLSLFYSKNKAPNGPNYTRFTNQKFDQLYEQAFKEVSEEKRNSIYQQMDQIIADEVPAIILFYDRAARFSHQNVKGLGINPMNNLFLKRVYKE
ncbi:ABC transporter substrate-binding protein [Myroides odoratimimus]|uniref:ABC transporter substrate-binding protein n=1 Tax=Myroides odoratimimus TaxID=76832 RepID=UPI0004694BF3|nr:ABC transporter substrate-binding protein [Myroides odoratimimus]MCA4807291.1 ABC transporter substrate-binding protein [Myroides odoratimimus]MDM1415601.1 ABC transporter substrate-binding protein [Myroides odoratimimus]MDM1448093.1 ABC transporter substrate-binding protein [Myroides odoratimimus]MDM1511034.1 ABC transporter substrate-binding protein [Myroides odoratimimus]MDM1513823.1 ABC transporter substrate-binding protein [Myroides odoratimimus]